METEPDEWRVLSLPAIQVDPDTGERSALWPLKHTLEELDRLRDVDPVTFDTQYLQNPTPKGGLMYEQGFKTYTPDMLPRVPIHCRLNVTDTADKGTDDLCSIDFINTPEFAYVIDITFTDSPMEVTERAVANMLHKDRIYLSYMESNNGGRGFARNVKRLLRTKLHNMQTTIRTYTQTSNKITRIYTASAAAQSDILFPVGWESRWPKFYKKLTTYRKAAKPSDHDDAPEGVTLIVELRQRKLAAPRGVKLRNG
jgi:predicted phage terminase large subunit-like protein